MSWTEHILEVAARADLPTKTTRAALDAFVALVHDALAHGEDVHVHGLGTFSSRWEPERTLRSVKDGRKLAIDGRHYPTFRPSAGLRTRVRARTPQVLRGEAHQRAWRLAEALVGDLDLYNQKDAPGNLTPETNPTEVELRCATALGAAWARARQTWCDQTPAEVREARDHLAVAARKRWASPRG